MKKTKGMILTPEEQVEGWVYSDLDEEEDEQTTLA